MFMNDFEYYKAASETVETILENEDVDRLAIDLFENLSKNKLPESEKIAEDFFNSYFGEHGINISEEEIKKEMKNSGVLKGEDE